MSLDKIRAVIDTEEVLNGFSNDYDVELTIIRKSDGKGTKLDIEGLQDVFQIDFLLQFIQAIRNHEQIDKQVELDEYMKKLREEKEKKNAKKTN